MNNWTGLELLKKLEGCRLHAYQDQAGVWTIGYGHTKDVHAGDVWTQEQCDQAIVVDAELRVAGVREQLGRIELKDNQFSALVIFAFNVGLVALHGSTAMRDIKAGSLSAVPAALALWNKIHDRSGVPVVNAGLVARREAEGNLWRTA